MLRSGLSVEGGFKVLVRCLAGPAEPVHVVELSGDVDSAKAPFLERELVRVIAFGEPVVVDCGGLVFVASSGLRAFVPAARRAVGLFSVAALAPPVRDVLAATGIDRIVDVRRSVAAAVEAAGAAGRPGG